MLRLTGFETRVFRVRVYPCSHRWRVQYLVYVCTYVCLSVCVTKNFSISKKATSHKLCSPRQKVVLHKTGKLLEVSVAYVVKIKTNCTE